VGLLQQLQQIRNTRDSLNLQLRTLSLLEAYLDAGVIDLVQVDQFRQNIETERAQLLQAENALINSLENYKVGTLGLPPDLPVEMDDQLIERFQLVDPDATALQTRIADLQRQLGELPVDPEMAELEGLLDELSSLEGEFRQRFSTTEEDLQEMESAARQREQAMSDQERSLFARDRHNLATTLKELESRFTETVPEMEKLQQNLTPASRRQSTADLVVILGNMYRLVGELILIQARARLESVVVEPVELRSDEAFQVALMNRLDIMNSRAELVDTWRLIAFNADALQAGLDVVLEGDLSTARNNPVSFRAPTGSVRAGLRFDAPFTRLLERNNYRQSLIDYQRDRRQFIQSLDSVHRDLRQLLRSLEELRVNLEIQRRAVAISIRRVDLTQEELNKPVPPPEPGQPAAQFGPTAALDLLTALSDLRNTQNNFMSVWLNYYATRMVLMRELGIMALDEEGRWIDIPVFDEDTQSPEEIPVPPEAPTQWFDLVDYVEPERPTAISQASLQKMRRNLRR
jgi:outer membrane protein TolC